MKLALRPPKRSQEEGQDVAHKYIRFKSGLPGQSRNPGRCDIHRKAHHMDPEAHTALRRNMCENFPGPPKGPGKPRTARFETEALFREYRAPQGPPRGPGRHLIHLKGPPAPDVPRSGHLPGPWSTSRGPRGARRAPENPGGLDSKRKHL
jgi:hypothetical protein